MVVHAAAQLGDTGWTWKRISLHVKTWGLGIALWARQVYSLLVRVRGSSLPLLPTRAKTPAPGAAWGFFVVSVGATASTHALVARVGCRLSFSCGWRLVCCAL